VATALEGDYDIVAYDARYHGKSDGPAGGQLAGGEDVVAVVEALALERPAIMGHSMGARSVAQAAGMRPELFRCAVLEDPPWWDERPTMPAPPAQPDLPSMTVEAVVAYGRERNPMWHDDEFPAWAEAKQQFRPPANAFTRAGSIAAGWRGTVEAMGVPALLLCGGNADRGRIVSPGLAAEACSLNPRIEVVTFPEAGHNVRREAFDGVVDAVRDFMARH
jgi:pimeloyl-ACP methyl ester carboxylesterase